MNAVGIFAGRGDVIIAMVMSLCFGVWIGWKLRSVIGRLPFLSRREM